MKIISLWLIQCQSRRGTATPPEGRQPKSFFALQIQKSYEPSLAPSSKKAFSSHRADSGSFRTPTRTAEDGSLPTRPTPRHFKDLPASLAFSPLGCGERGDIMGTMATYAAFQSRCLLVFTDHPDAICIRNRISPYGENLRQQTHSSQVWEHLRLSHFRLNSQLAF